MRRHLVWPLCHIIFFKQKEGRMGVEKKLNALLFQASLDFILFTLVGSSQEHTEVQGNNSSNKDNQIEMNPRLLFQITVHGFLLWASMGFLMPVAILAIRLANVEENPKRLRFIFYVHAILELLAVLLATTGAIMSIKYFNNLFNNNHQRLGVSLYGIIWLQLLIGIFRPKRGSKRRRVWFFAHWILGTAVSVLGVMTVYTGLGAYHEKTSKSTRIWYILFTVQISLVVFFYLFQEKWVYIQNQGVILGSELMIPNCQEIRPEDKEMKKLKVECC